MIHLADRLETLPGGAPGTALGPAGEGYFRIAPIVGANRPREAVVRLEPLLDELASVPVEATR